MSRRFILLLAAMSVASFVMPSNAETYIVTMQGNRIRWQVVDASPGVAETVDYYVNITGSQGLSNNTIAGVEIWNSIAGNSFRFSYVTSTNNAGFDFNGVNAVSYDDPDGDLGAGVLAAAVPYVVTDQYTWDSELFNEIAEFDIVFNNGINFDADPPGAGFSMEAVSLHEAGHALGLDHPDQAMQGVAAVMNSTIPAGQSLAMNGWPTADDAQGVAGTGGPDPRDGLYRSSIPNVYPAFSVSSTQGYAPLGLIFTNESVGGTAYSWNFGDGGTSTQTNPTYTYNDPGTFNAVLSVNGVASPAQSIFVANTLIVDFVADVTSGGRPLTVEFTNQTSGITNAFTWDFGDGTGSAEENPTHEYLDDGTYTVTLTIEGEAGPVAGVRTDYITVGGDGEDDEEKKGPFAQFFSDLGCNCAISAGGAPSRMPLGSMAIVFVLALGAVVIRRKR